MSQRGPFVWHEQSLRLWVGGVQGIGGRAWELMVGDWVWVVSH